jgi:hypothetical protein
MAPGGRSTEHVAGTEILGAADSAEAEIDECLKNDVPTRRITQEAPAYLSSAAQQAWARFQRHYKVWIKKPESISLSILIWGPNPGSQSRVARKREAIRQALINRGHHAFFSEELPDPSQHEFLIADELAQARAADLIIVLVEDAPGARAEVIDFCNRPEIIQKVLVMVPEGLRQSYIGRGPLSIIEDGYGGVFWYTDDDLENCRVLTKAIRRVEARRLVKALTKGGMR